MDLVPNRVYRVTDKLYESNEKSYTWGMPHRDDFLLQAGMFVRLLTVQDYDVTFEAYLGSEVFSFEEEGIDFILSRTLAEKWLTGINLCAECESECEESDYLCTACRGKL